MSIERVTLKILIEGEDIKRISDAMELARRYISEKKTLAGVAEYSPQQVKEIQRSMSRYWEN